MELHPLHVCLYELLCVFSDSQPFPRAAGFKRAEWEEPREQGPGLKGGLRTIPEVSPPSSLVSARPRLLSPSGLWVSRGRGCVGSGSSLGQPQVRAIDLL